MANICVTYFLWLVGGWFGLHHFYLKRDKQAFIWWCFPGGYFGLGWIRDLWRIPEYVKEANEEKLWTMQQQAQLALQLVSPLLAAQGSDAAIGHCLGLRVQEAHASFRALFAHGLFHDPSYPFR